MCGRYIPNTDFEMKEIINLLVQMKAEFPQSDIQNLSTEGKDVYPTHITPVIYFNDGMVHIHKIKWGFEKWDGKGIIINAKSETAETGRFFSPYVKTNRCLIPAHGYYEWQTMPDKKKIKNEFSNDNPLGIFMAGLYRQNKDESEFVILTKSANPDISFIHDRMPLMIESTKIQDWLSGSRSIIDYSSELYDINFKEVV
jgi:putative SOS response-associated peptidase YedK